MRKLLPAALSAFFLGLQAFTPAFAIDASVMRQLNALAPEERLEQRCDIEAMERIATEQKGMKPDKVIAYTYGDPEVGKNSIKAPGAAFRSAGEWYRLKYKCQLKSDSLSIQSFDYRVGDKIPEEQWKKLYLYD
ncbi:DUF930 domain-containing protein [Agrobacterium sp. NPDC058088]|uniref:DUF930 domain-containing protein n=1 Tax=Agrobacterium sp. NPDC058088 TaxID=3346335 RepID=UPI0036D8B8B0